MFNKYLDNTCSCMIIATGEPKDIAQFNALAQDFSFSAVVKVDDDTAVDEIARLRRLQWGTPIEAVAALAAVGDDQTSIAFHTYQTPPVAAFVALCSQYPSLTLQMGYLSRKRGFYGFVESGPKAVGRTVEYSCNDANDPELLAFLRQFPAVDPRKPQVPC